jgi:threonine 3-dehydrogenase
MSGAVPGVQTCFEAVRIAGTIVALGIPKKEVSIDWGKYLIDKELRIESIFGRRIWETWYRTSDLLTSGAIDLKKIITHTFALKDFEKAMAVMKSGKCGKVVLKIG